MTLTTEFVAHFGRTPELTAYAPGRVNLIGDHTDYNAGFVLPAAVNFGTRVWAARRSDRRVQVIAADYEGELVGFDLNSLAMARRGDWTDYVAGVLLALRQRFPALAGADLLVSGNVPKGAGLSSSASFEIALLRAFSELYRLPLTGVEAAQLGQQAENAFVGCQCGIMDQLISALGQQKHAMLLDCQDLHYKHAHLPDNHQLLIVNSNVERTLVASEYNSRREQCEAVARHFGVATLRELSLETLHAGEQALAPELFRRARHVISENTRTVAAFESLQQGDIRRLGRLMYESHASLRDDFQVSTAELDCLVDILATVLGERGGARMTGGGFGGCVVALVPDELLTPAKQAVLQQYPVMSGLTPDVYICSAEQGAFSEENNIKQKETVR